MVNSNFYLQDHQGPRSNKEGLIILRELRACLARSAGEQVEPLGEGGLIGNLSSNEGLQEFKFEDKELDRTYGLDWYDIQARQYDAAAPIWNAPEDLNERIDYKKDKKMYYYEALCFKSLLH